MAAKTPTAVGTSGHVPPKTGLYGGVATATNNLLSDVAEPIENRSGLRLEVYHFADIDNADTWASGITTIKAVAWQPEDATDDAVRAYLASQAGSVAFLSVNANSAGWLWVLRGE